MKKMFFASYSLALLGLGGLIQSNCGSATAQNSVTASDVAFDLAIWNISFSSTTSMAMFTDNGRTLWVLAKSS